MGQIFGKLLSPLAKTTVSTWAEGLSVWAAQFYIPVKCRRPLKGGSPSSVSAYTHTEQVILFKHTWLTTEVEDNVFFFFLWKRQPTLSFLTVDVKLLEFEKHRTMGNSAELRDKLLWFYTSNYCLLTPIWRLFVFLFTQKCLFPLF